jgi:hypothetical protein
LGQGDDAARQLFRQWQENGTRTITRIAETPQTFARACAELPGLTMIDEGLTEVEPNSKTVHATWPMKRFPAHKCLKHKRIPLLGSEPILETKRSSK